MSVPDRVGVIGGGRMGSGIAHAFVLAGAEVCVVERDAGAAEAARGAVERAVAESVRRGVVDHAGPVLQRVRVSARYEDLEGAGLVVEAVPEKQLLKVESLRRAEDVVGPGAVLATNTSSLSVHLIAEDLQHPGRLLGMHFFNPVPASKLVEVVVGPETEDDLPGLVVQWVTALGKTPIVVKDSPGFASSRLGVALGLEAIRMLEEGVASAEDIDAAMTLGYGHPMGPLRLTDLVGLDVRLGIARFLHESVGERFRPPGLLVEMVERGDLGRKTGRGFYAWE
ncbi:3-hydroxyacyl-CoA dehydrogenase family protein [Georgenia sp. AZ-5]|uniref:3-hydroxyacyl-CoA dehydrogenase family protein n=1 Tax=Georgenia sp. AZ-5 TaxID=3367526 RepID=UPI0037550987